MESLLDPEPAWQNIVKHFIDLQNTTRFLTPLGPLGTIEKCFNFYCSFCLMFLTVHSELLNRIIFLPGLLSFPLGS